MKSRSCLLLLAGAVLCATVQAAAGNPIPGFTLADSTEIFGDALDRVVAWKNGPDLSKLAGKPIRLRFVLEDANLYALRFE